MVSQQLSFRIIECPAGVNSLHTHLVVNGRGVPHEPLTLFYEHLQKTCAPATMQATMSRLLSFFSFIEQQDQGNSSSDFFQEEQSCSLANMKANYFTSQTTWACPPSEIQAAVRGYLFAHWGCLTRPHSQSEEILLLPMGKEIGEIQRFLAALQQFYGFVLERRDYWYDRNPAAAFRLPLHSRLLRAITPTRFSFRSRPVSNQRSVDEGVKEEIVPARTPAASREEQPLPVVHLEEWIQLVAGNVGTTSQAMTALTTAE